MGRSAGGAFALGLSRSLEGISTSIEPTWYGPVCCGKAGVGFNRLSQVMLAGARGVAVRMGMRAGRARARDVTARENDSVISMSGRGL